MKMAIARLHELLSDLKHHDPSRRRAAAESLANSDERALPSLISLLEDSNLGVQDAAIHSLMQMKSRSAASLILPLLREGSYLRNTAMLILGEMGDHVVPLLRDLLKDEDEDIRKYALDLLFEIGRCDYPEEIAAILQNDANANVRAAAAKVLGILHYKDAVPDLLMALHDDEWVCFSALEALTLIQDKQVVYKLIDLFDKSSDTIRAAIISTLGNIDSHRAHDFLSELLKQTNGFEKKTILKALIQSDSYHVQEDVSDLLIELLKEDDWHEISYGLRGFTNLKDIRAIPIIAYLAVKLDISVPDHEDKIVLIKEALQNQGCTESLVNIIRDETVHDRIKVVVVEVLGDLMCREAVPLLIDLLNSHDRDIRRSGIDALQKIQSADIKDPLMKALNNTDSHVRKSAAIALGRMKVEEAFEPLLIMLQNEEYDDVKEECINSLFVINPSLLLSQAHMFNTQTKHSIEKHAAIIQAARK